MRVLPLTSEWGAIVCPEVVGDKGGLPSAELVRDLFCQKGVVFHLIGVLSEFGKVGVLCIAPSHEEAEALHRRTTAVLDRESTAV